MFDTCANPTTRTGDALYDQIRNVGTLGAVMSSPRPGKADAYVVLTAGHVIPNGDDRLFVKNRKLDTLIPLRVAPMFRRFNDRPLHHQNRNRSFQDDVGILFIEENDLEHFSRRIANLNVHHLDPDCHKLSLSQMTNPVHVSRRNSLETLLLPGSIIVHKTGASTDLTMGRFVKILDYPPMGWYEPEEDDGSDLEEAEKDEDEWLGLVEWIDNVPFATSGDSGSLVFAREDGVHVPLGIHVGSKESTSIFVSLETFCYEAESEGLELRFHY